MTPDVFLSILADAIQFHEGWSGGNPAFNNLNPGNLKFIHQTGATQSPNGFAIFPNFYQGKQAQINDLRAKLGKYDTIQEIISVYAPPSDNDTAAYIASVTQFFSWRNIVIKPTDSIKGFLNAFNTPLVLVVFDNLYVPTDWHPIQQAVSQCATYMPLYSFVCDYSSIDLTNDVITISSPISASTSVISGDATKESIVPFNQGEILNVMVYNGLVMQGHESPAGGCEYQGIKIDPVSAISSVMYQGPTFVDPTARVIFHELIHEFASILEVPDTLHSYLIDHDGYAVNSARDLLAYFNGNALNNTQSISNLKAEKNTL